jgi:hypothetical protein
MGLNRLMLSKLLIISGIAITVLAIAWGLTLVWPDNVHVNYGFPLVWATHTLNTIAGPVDKWNVNISFLVFDVVFWQGLMAIIVVVVLRNYGMEAKKG